MNTSDNKLTEWKIANALAEYFNYLGQNIIVPNVSWGLPKKARTAKSYSETGDLLVTYFRKGKIQKFFKAGGKGAVELDFVGAAGILECDPDTAKKNLPNNFYDLLNMNKDAFHTSTSEVEIEVHKIKTGRESGSQLLKILKTFKDFRQFTDEQEKYWRRVIEQLSEGGIPKQTSKTALHEVKEGLKKSYEPLHVLAILQKCIALEFLKGHAAEGAAQTAGPREVILSEFLKGN